MRLPKLCRHRGTGQAYVRLAGRQVYLGVAGSPEAESAYRRHLADFLANDGHVPVADADLTVVELAARYWGHVQSRQFSPSHAANIKFALDAFVDMFGDTNAADFGPNRLRVLRRAWADRGLSGRTCTAYTTSIKQMFSWAAARELLPASIHAALKVLEPLRQGHDVPRREPVGPVPLEDVEAALLHMPGPLAALVRVQLLTGARPGELVGLRPCDIDTTGEIWVVRLAHHKTQHLGKVRSLYLGPRGQSVIRPFLLRPADAPLFSALESFAERRADVPGPGRRPGQAESLRRTERRMRDAYDATTYRKAVHTACRAAGCAVWSPNQLRHNCATSVRAAYGLEGAQILLGHAKAATSEIYAQRDETLALRIARERG